MIESSSLFLDAEFSDYHLGNRLKRVVVTDERGVETDLSHILKSV